MKHLHHDSASSRQPVRGFTAQGFTLLELMVTVVIMGLILGGVGIGLMQRDQVSELQDMGEDVRDQLRWASDQALISGEHIALVPTLQDGEAGLINRDDEVWQLNWYRWRDEKWIPEEEIPPIAPTRETEVSVEIDNEPLDFWEWLEKEKDDKEAGKEVEVRPALVFYGGGEATEGVLIGRFKPEFLDQLENSIGTEWHLEINPMGRVAWRERAELEARLEEEEDERS